MRDAAADCIGAVLLLIGIAIFALTGRETRSRRLEEISQTGTLTWNQRHLMTVLRAYEDFYNARRPHRTLNQAAPLRPLPERSW
jgi:hypothetical protein